eukprot:TRINITY_DN5191_c0_g1_i1.p2 TRINITY_DN5191_c0_g1~~TRINITY_DN5191_c0_g1_i1.p2  ORF type:complete len:125 (+),score=14.24 TRINITY_DN5191_c0_g1_i1:68-442(+)
MSRRPPRSTHCISSAASDVYKRQWYDFVHFLFYFSYLFFPFVLVFFVILLGNILNSEDAKSVGEKILAAFAEPIETSAGPLQVSCSIGISICPLHGESLDILRKSADRAMYLSKGKRPANPSVN